MNVPQTQLNPVNKLVTVDFIESLFNKVNLSSYQISKLTNYQTAFVHKSYVKKHSTEEDDDCIPFQPESNEVFEFIGDSVLGSFVTFYCHIRYPDQREGFLTTLKSKLVKTEMLSKFARYCNLNDYMIISRHLETKEGRDNPNLLENTFEAFVGAIFIDQGGYLDLPHSLRLPYQFVQNVIEQVVDFSELNAVNDNYKDTLMKIFQQNFKGRHAIYRLLSTEGVPGKQIFTCGVQHPLYPDKIVATGKGKRKPMAEQDAARNALENMDKILTGS
jgi:ribonuclease-3